MDFGLAGTRCGFRDRGERCIAPPPKPALLQTECDEQTPRLALRPKEAALALGISERLLWSKTNAGDIPHCRVGRTILYPIDLLREWLAQQAIGGTDR